MRYSRVKPAKQAVERTETAKRFVHVVADLATIIAMLLYRKMLGRYARLGSPRLLGIEQIGLRMAEVRSEARNRGPSGRLMPHAEPLQR